LGTGTLTISVGGTNTSITIDATNNTLTGLKDKINNSGAAVTASIVNIGAATPDYRLIVQSKNTGTANGVTISGALSGGGDPFAGGGNVVQAAADAQFTVNGLSLTRSSNTISDAISGATFNLLKDGGASSTITVASDTGAVTGTVKNFVDAYNAAIKIVNDQFKLDPSTNKQGTLGGDAVLRGVASQLRAAISSVGGIGSGIKYVSDIGIRFEKDGTLSLDESKLTSALSSNPDGVKNLFLSTQNGIGKRVPNVIDRFINSVSGALTTRQNGITASIGNIDKKIAREEERIATYEKNLTDQFTALEKVVSQMNQQSQFLSQQLTSLSQ
jgi:flagellar hook-associated protein 2